MSSQPFALPQTTPGVFITFEGIDGAGKTTHMDTLERLLQSQGREVVRTREPGGTPLAEKLRALFLHDAMDPLTETLLVFAARRDHLTQVILPALARGAWVMCDRFTDATFAYQGGGRGFDLQILGTLEGWVQERHQPDLTFLFDLPPAVAASRLAAARQPDRFEAQDTAFFERVRQAYLRRREQQPERFALIQADASPEAVAEQILHIVQAKGWA
ncbi:MAG: dTMP kinase [Burkholderiales bacterium]|nr:dTMP kinase [Burkholderiales bacterium]